MPNELARSMPIDAIEAWSYGENKLRILMVISSPLDETIRLNTKHEIESIYRQLSYSKAPVALIRLNPPTWQCLHTTLHRRHFDIVHFIGYARKDAIQLEKENGSADWVSADHLTDLFRNTGIKLVVINNCSTESLGDSLVTINVPAIIVTSRKTQSDLAISPSGALYASIASRNSPEQAVKTIDHMLRRQRSDREETFIAALRSGADQPLLERDLGSGNTDFFSCYPPNNLPPTSQETIVDRIPDHLKLYKLMDRSTSPFIGIVGLAGSGKSTVAIAAAWRYRWRFDRGIAYASLRNMRPFNLTHLLAHLEWGLEEVPSNKQRSVALHELTRGPILIVLDDLENAQPEECRDIIDLLSSWDTSLGGRAILVMRRQRPEFDSLVQSNWLRIGQLPERAALDLFSDLMGGSETAQAKLRSNLPKIPDLCYCHPKLLTLTAAALQMEIPWKQLALPLRRLMGKPLEQMTQVLELTCDQVANRESQNDKKGMGSTLHEIGRTFHETKRIEEARAFYYKSLVLRRERGDLTGLQATLHQLGLLAFDQGDLETAKQYYGESTELSNSLNDRFWIAHNKFRYGRLLWRLGEQDKACSHAQESLRVCNVLGIALKKEVEDWLRSPS